MEGSTRLASSEIDGNLQPFRPPTSLSAQAARASVQDISAVSRVFSHTSPVSLSRTAASPKALKMVNREALGSFLSQFLSKKCVAELESDGETALAGLSASVNPTRAVSPSISVQVCCCIMRVMRSLLGMGTVGDSVQSSVRVKSALPVLLPRAAATGNKRGHCTFSEGPGLCG